jgi:hypothetical protein
LDQEVVREVLVIVEAQCVRIHSRPMNDDHSRCDDEQYGYQLRGV